MDSVWETDKPTAEDCVDWYLRSRKGEAEKTRAHTHTHTHVRSRSSTHTRLISPPRAQTLIHLTALALLHFIYFYNLRFDPQWKRTWKRDRHRKVLCQIAFLHHLLLLSCALVFVLMHTWLQSQPGKALLMATATNYFNDIFYSLQNQWLHCSTICIGVDKDQCFCQLVLVWFLVHWSVCGIGNCQCAHLCLNGQWGFVTALFSFPRSFFLSIIGLLWLSPQCSHYKTALGSD